MKKNIFTNFALICLFSIQSAFSTNVSGSIHSNTTWTLANSPYHVTGNVIVFPGNKLTIEPGVWVIFDGNYELEIRGELVADGTSSNNIYFCGEMIITGSDTAYVHWKRILIEPNNKGKGSFTYCSFKDAEAAIERIASTSQVFNCVFEYNDVGLLSHNYADQTYTTVKNCVFRNNKRGISYSQFSRIQNCKFINNDEGLYDGFRANFDNCEFTYNRNGINWFSGNVKNSVFIYNDCGIKGANVHGSFDTIANCTLMYNIYGIDDSSQYSGGSIINNDISYNQVGVKVARAGDLVTYTNVVIMNNKICHNSIYNAINYNNVNKNFTNNCFCTDDSAEIDDKLYDGYDDATLGLLTYNIYDTGCYAKRSNVFKKLPVEDKDTGCITFKGCDSQTSINHAHTLDLDVFPAPFSEKLQIETGGLENASVHVTDMFGKVIYTMNTEAIDSLYINTSSWANGIYILSIRSNEGIYTSKILKN